MRTAIFSKPAYIKFISNEYANQLYWLFLCSTSLSVFLFDLYSPLGVAAGTPYALIVFGSLWFKSNQSTYIAIISGVSLIIIGFFLSPEQLAPMNVVLTNRILALIAITITAFMVFKIKFANLELNALMTESYIDPLTQSKNKRAFEAELVTEIKRSQRYNHHLSLAIFHIDFLDEAEDPTKTNSSHSSNEPVKKIFNEIKKCIRGSDQLYRTDVNQFAILFVETEMREVRVVCNILREKISNMNPPGSFHSPITVNVGIAMLDATDNERKLCKRAKKALLNAQREGKNQVSTLPQTMRNARPDIPAILSRPRSG